MKCPEFQDRWQRRLDGERPAVAPDAEQHLAECPDCRRLEAAARRLEAALRVLPPPEAPSAGLTDRIVAAVLDDRRARLRFRRRVQFVASLAASLLLIAAGYAYFRSHQEPTHPAGPAPVVQGPHVPDGAEPPARAATPSLDDSVAAAGSAVISLTKRTAGETVDETRILLPRTLPSPALVDRRVLPRDLVAGRPAQSLQETGQGMASGLEPVTTSARRAVDLFLNELPPMESGQKPGL
jgi:hypothetical protein